MGSADILWKTIIQEMFEEFFLFFAPDIYEKVDFQIPPEFLEQELHTIKRFYAGSVKAHYLHRIFLLSPWRQ